MDQVETIGLHNGRQGVFYLHYWFYNYTNGLSVSDYEQAKKIALREQKRLFKERYKNIVNGDTKYEKNIKQLFIDMYEDKRLEKRFQECIDQVKPLKTSGSTISVNGSDVSFYQLGKKSQDAVKAMSEDLVNGLSSIITESEKIVDELYSYIAQYKNSIIIKAITDYANSMDKAGKEDALDDQILKNAKISGKKWIKIPDNVNSYLAQAAQDYIRLKNRVEALKVLQGRINAGDLSKDNIDLIYILTGKIGGSISNAFGKLYEVSVSAGINSAETLAKKALKKLHLNIKATPVGMDFTEDKKIDEMSENNLFYKYQKDDVKIEISNSSVEFSFGIVIKNSNSKKYFNENGLFKGTIKLEDETNLYTLLLRAYEKDMVIFDTQRLYNIAGGVQDSQSEYNRISNDKVATEWKNMVKYAAVLNFLDFLAGNGLSGNNSIFLIIGKKVYSISSILDRVIQNTDAIQVSGGLQRFRFYNLNKNAWKGNKGIGNSRNIEQGEQRSEEVVKKITDEFHSIHVTTKLNMGLLNL